MNVQKMYKSNKNASIYSGECLALIEAVSFIIENNINRATVFSDSRGVLETVSGGGLDRDYNYLILVLKNKLWSAELQGMGGCSLLDFISCGNFGE